MAESAIAKHLVSSSALPPNLKEGYEPPYPTYTSRFSSKTTQIVIFILGSQHSSESRPICNSTEPGGIPPRIAEPWPSQISTNDEMATALRRMVDFVTTPPGECKPTFYDLASRTDNNGIYEQCLIAYWSTKTAYDDWYVTSGFGRWWSNLDPATVRHGWFLELLLPPIERHENAFTSAEVPEGTGHLQEGVSGAIREHGYWGSMRDRLPISQISHLNGDKITHGLGTVFDSRTRRIRVPGKSNLAVIRSGQDWSCTPPEERNLYVTRMHPVLTEGMNFLRDEGLQVGCYSCRFMDVLEKETGQPEVQKTFGLAYFNELASLEKWSEHHPTHKRIFQSFTRIAKKLQDNLSLRFFHEVLVLEPEQQFFEYVNCHPRSGMLSSL